MSLPSDRLVCGHQDARTPARTLGWLVVAAFAAAQPALLAAQATAPLPPRQVPPLVKWGKWSAAAVFVGLTVQGISRHEDADAAYRQLVGHCRAGGSCVLAANGSYADPRSEALYQETVSGDRAARAWLITGQAALVGAVALLIVELSYEHGQENIPYEPRAYVAPGRGSVLVGLRVSVGRR